MTITDEQISRAVEWLRARADNMGKLGAYSAFAFAEAAGLSRDEHSALYYALKERGYIAEVDRPEIGLAVYDAYILQPYGRHLPLFPCFNDPPREDALERCAERLMDRADAALSAGKASQAEYDRWCTRLDAWVREQAVRTAV